MLAARSLKGFRDRNLVKGLASLNIRENHIRRQQIETFLRYSIPVLVIIFVAIAGAAIALHLAERRAASISEAEQKLKLTADLLAARLETSSLTQVDTLTETEQALADDLVENLAIDATKAVILVDKDNNVLVSHTDPLIWKGQSFDALIRSDQGSVDLAARAKIVETVLFDDVLVSTAIRSFGPNNAFRLFVIQHRHTIEASSNASITFFVTLFSSTSLVLLLLCGAFFWQAAQADKSDIIYEKARVRLNSALESGMAGLWDWDIAGGRVFWSRSMFNILGLSSNNHILSLDEINQRVHPQDIDLYALANDLMESETPDTEIDQIFRIRNIEGDWVWLRMRGKLITENGNNAVHLVGITMDISEQRDLNEKLDLSSIALADAINTASEAFVLWDKENNMVLCNNTYLEFHNLPEEINKDGVSYDDAVRRAGNAVVRTIAANANEHQRGNRTFEALMEDGRWLKVSERRTSDGGYVSLGTDITPLKKHEERLMESERELMGTIVDLQHSRQTLEEQAQQLIDLAEKYSREKERAEAANKSKSDFLANVSHEFRTPLNAVIGFTGIMESETFGSLGSDKYVEYCRDIRESGEFLMNFINDILDMSKIEVGNVKLHPEDLVIGDIVSESVRIIATRAEKEKIAITEDIASDLSLKADRRSIKQILLNLLSNAVKFTSANGNITIKGRQLSDTVQFKIIDTGIGIPSDAIASLCRPFEQVQNQFTKDHDGSGLGLAISRSLVELHGGKLELESVEGQGTTVTVTLPAEPALEVIMA